MSRLPEPSAWRLIASREISVRARDKGFVISIALCVLGIIAAIAASTFVGDRPRDLVIAGNTDYVHRLAQQGQQLADSTGVPLRISVLDAPDAAAVDEAVRSSEADLGLAHSGPSLTLIGRTELETAGAAVIREAHVQLQLEANAERHEVDVTALLAGSQLPERVLSPGELTPGTIRIVGAVLTAAFYVMSLVFGAAVAQSVLEEKQNRVVEILTALVPIRSLLIGKLVGTAVVSLAQVALFTGAVVAGLSLRDSTLAVPRLGLVSVWFVGLFAVGLMGVNALWAIAGAMATRPEDLQSTATPVSLLLAAVLPVGMFLSGSALTIASFVPVVNVVAMPTRLLAEPVPSWHISLSLGGLVITTGLLILLAETVYRRSLLRTQGRLNLRQALRMQV